MTSRVNYRYTPPLEADAEKACRLTSETLSARKEPPEDFFAAANDQQVLPNGYELRFEAGPGMPARVNTFIDEEGQCCPFFAFEQWEEDGQIVVRILRPATSEDD
jgi:hypothetical protein